MDIAIPRFVPLDCHVPVPAAPPAPPCAPSAWDRHAVAQVERLALRRDATVLEVGCGGGSAAIAAACAVGPQGHVVGVDVDEPLLRRARDRARALGLRHVDFLSAYFGRLPFPDEAFDAVLCLFHFGPGLDRRLRELWRLVAPGGTLAVTVCGLQVFEPIDPDERAQMADAASACGLAEALRAAGAVDVEVEADGELLIGRARKPA